MDMPIGEISGNFLKDISLKSINYHKTSFFDKISEFDKDSLFHAWRELVRGIDEIINIPVEMKNENEIQQFLLLSVDFSSEFSMVDVFKVLKLVGDLFGSNVSERLKNLLMMSYGIEVSYKQNRLLINDALDFSTVADWIAFYQSRRRYYVTILGLIPSFAHGKKKIDKMDVLNEFQYLIDSCLVQITNASFNLLLNETISDFKLISDGVVAVRNNDFNHLEGFYMEPSSISLIDQLELRPEIVKYNKMLEKSENKIFSFCEVANALSSFEGAFQKYNINQLSEYNDMSSFFCEIATFLSENDFDVIIPVDKFRLIQERYPNLLLTLKSQDYFDALNGFSPFQQVGNLFYSTVVLLTRFVVNTLSNALMKNKSFKINAGFVFEEKCSKILENYGYVPTNITRINHKEFDLITLKNEAVYNFQCKNNYFPVSNVSMEYKLLARLNRLLYKYYERALIKEEKRENLIKEKTGVSDIRHYIISRFPVVSKSEKIICFKDLEKWCSE